MKATLKGLNSLETPEFLSNHDSMGGEHWKNSEEIHKS